jgi:hypothetical protein
MGNQLVVFWLVAFLLVGFAIGWFAKPMEVIKVQVVDEKQTLDAILDAYSIFLTTQYNLTVTELTPASAPGLRALLSGNPIYDHAVQILDFSDFLTFLTVNKFNVVYMSKEGDEHSPMFYIIKQGTLFYWQPQTGGS